MQTESMVIENKTMVSVIMPVYNASATVGRMVDSIIGQTFKDWELIAVDDGSTDGSEGILDEYAKTDSRIKVIHKSNGGVASARQTGMDAANGVYTIHADSDDWVEPTMLEDMLDMAEKEKADIVIADYYTESVAGTTQYISQQSESVEPFAMLKALYAKGLFGGLWHKLIKKEAYNKVQVRFIPGIDYCEDMLVLTKILLYSSPKIVCLPKAYYHYVVNPNSLTQRVSAKGLLSMKRFHEEVSKILPRNEEFDNIVKSFALNEFLVLFTNRLYDTRSHLKSEFARVKDLITSKNYGLRWRCGFRCIDKGFVSLAHKLIKF